MNGVINAMILPAILEQQILSIEIKLLRPCICWRPPACFPSSIRGGWFVSSDPPSSVAARTLPSSAPPLFHGSHDLAVNVKIIIHTYRTTVYNIHSANPPVGDSTTEFVFWNRKHSWTTPDLSSRCRWLKRQKPFMNVPYNQLTLFEKFQNHDIFLLKFLLQIRFREIENLMINNNTSSTHISSSDDSEALEVTHFFFKLSITVA